MRVMAIVKASKDSEGGILPSTAQLDEMIRFNEGLAAAGVMLAGEGLHRSSKGCRVRSDGERKTVIDGPFTETKELIAGFWIWKVASMEEAVEWARKAPFHEGDLELRPVFEPDDFGETMTPELRARQDKLDEQLS